ncbi:glycoside hydrolase family 65 protein [Salipaludibacillus aurantiacus]|uniref:Alpha,alpha-trehalose phosphorylase n=1 Tax=Salipaludibacillus aurantiacus TaxID=1601833 RepID=A0A1H9UED3_9BACI|nr:glycosyl hydrolase family 65 protein [Salipaludibacillus aurantiacus]SES07712.1 alpha,alpha-trehalose phosphorylase [Salipaludibacillus aurantiacus]
MVWHLTQTGVNKDSLLENESLYALGNGYIGVRGNFEEGYKQGMTSVRGTYINAFHDVTGIEYGEKLHAFPETQQKLLNVIDAQTVEIYINGERFSVFDGTVLNYEQNLYFDKGYSERIIEWESPQGAKVKLHFRRVVSFVTRELFAINVKIEPLSKVNTIKVWSELNGDVSNFTDPNDPRVASGHAKRLTVEEVDGSHQQAVIVNKTLASNLSAACVSESTCTPGYEYKCEITSGRVQDHYTWETNEAVEFTKKNVFTDTLRHGEDLKQQAFKVQNEIGDKLFETLLQEQEDYLNNFWNHADVQVEGDDKLQEGIRFNLFHLLQSVGKDSVSNIAAKGLSGEGYEGHYFWDTEIYMFPVFLMTNPELAKKLLLHRYSVLEAAKERAKEVGHAKGALFSWRTITGSECSAFFPAGTAQYHISADIAYSYIQYYLVTGDNSFMKEYGAEVLAETARLWLDTGHFHKDQFRIDDVTGPDEYTCIVNNNYFTNAMAKHNLKWAAKVINQNTDKMRELNVTENEVKEWEEAAEMMYLPYDEELGINAQDDTFLQKKVWDLKNTPADKYPLLLNYHPLTLYRYQVCKQADTVLSHFLLEDEQDIDTIRRSYDYYEKVTTHDSSLSYCVYSIMAAKLGYDDKAYNYFMETARLDLDNTHGNTKDGLHMANMGGTWLSIVFGFGGVRIKEDGLFFSPSLPSQLNGINFNMTYQDRLIKVILQPEQVEYRLLEGEPLTIHHFNESVKLESKLRFEL